LNTDRGRDNDLEGLGQADQRSPAHQIDVDHAQGADGQSAAFSYGET
jgi:hypothetical protein